MHAHSEDTDFFRYLLSLSDIMVEHDELLGKALSNGDKSGPKSTRKYLNIHDKKVIII